MKKIDFGQMITILANIGVIAGIAFLAIELRQNNALLRSDAEYRVTQNRMLFVTELLGDIDLLTAYRKAEAGEDLNEIERDRLSFLYRRMYNSLAWEWAQAARGLTPQFPVERFRYVIGRDEVAAETWKSVQHDFEEIDPDFYEFLVENDFLVQ